MKSSGESIVAMQSANQPIEGGATPTSPLLFHKQEWEVRPCSLDVTQRLVQKHHYSHGGSNTAVYTHGLWKREDWWEVQCNGVCWWIPPTKSAAASLCQNWQGVLSLSRLVIVPGVPSNACTFLIRHSMRQIDKKRWPFFVTYADTELMGHTGAIYKAAGWSFDGWTKRERVYRLNGRLLARKAGPKTRTHAEMLALGCELVGSFRRKRFVYPPRWSPPED